MHRVVQPCSRARHVIDQPSSCAQHVVGQPGSSCLVDVVPVFMAWYLPPPAHVAADALGLGLQDVSVHQARLEDLLAGATILGLV